MIANILHAGDGNLHPNITFDRRDPEQLRTIKEVGAEILRICVAAGGALSGEHGIGLEKRDHMCLVFSRGGPRADALGARRRSTPETAATRAS